MLSEHAQHSVLPATPTVLMWFAFILCSTMRSLGPQFLGLSSLFVVTLAAIWRKRAGRVNMLFLARANDLNACMQGGRQRAVTAPLGRPSVGPQCVTSLEWRSNSLKFCEMQQHFASILTRSSCGSRSLWRYPSGVSTVCHPNVRKGQVPEGFPPVRHD